jgi:16S rRNA (cytidine1402-2'-O)-methyltransferase
MSILYVVSTPIGNLKDISERAKEILTETKLILSEDTRNTKKLFSLLGINYNDKQFISYYDNVEAQKAPEILEKLRSIDNAVLVSDAGTPLINDPGYKLIKMINETMDKNLKIEVIPGPSAVTTALISSGFPPDKFFFVGYLPRKSGQFENMMKDLESINNIQKTTFISFESPYRLTKSLQLFDSYFSDRIKIAVCNELTKKFEKVYIGTPVNVIEQLKSFKIKGEITLVFNLNLKNE